MYRKKYNNAEFANPLTNYFRNIKQAWKRPLIKGTPYKYVTPARDLKYDNPKVEIKYDNSPVEPNILTRGQQVLGATGAATKPVRDIFSHEYIDPVTNEKKKRLSAKKGLAGLLAASGLGYYGYEKYKDFKNPKPSLLEQWWNS